MTLNYKDNLFYFKKSKLYVITCKKNNKHYIGQSSNVNVRLNAHKNKLKRNIHENKNLQFDFNKYGEKYFLFQKLIFGNGLDKQKWLELETVILITLQPNKRYNIYTNLKTRDPKLNPFFNKKHSLEARNTQSFSKLGKTSPFKNRKQTKVVFLIP